MRRRSHWFVACLAMSVGACSTEETEEPVTEDASAEASTDSATEDTAAPPDTETPDTATTDSGASPDSTITDSGSDAGADTHLADTSDLADTAVPETADDAAAEAAIDADLGDTRDAAEGADTADTAPQCTGGLTACGDAGACKDLTSDPQNCGQCGKVCTATESCTATGCAPRCTSPMSACFDASNALYCANLGTDSANCGTCGMKCGVGELCVATACVPPPITFSVTKQNLSTTNTGSRTCADGGDMVAYSVTALTTTTATLSASPSAGCLAAGDEVLLINLQGTASAYGNVGNNELLIVASVTGDTVTFTAAKTKRYGDGNNDNNLGLARTNQRVVLQRVPKYGDVTIAEGVRITANGWDGVKGGIFAMRSTGILTLSGSVDMNGKGFAGAPSHGLVSTGGLGGESLTGLAATRTRIANVGGGGGGTGATSGCRTYGTGGGGGAHAASGGSAQDAACGGTGGVSYVTPASSRLFLGSGGGAGGTDDTTASDPASGAGGAGGGIVLLLAPEVAVVPKGGVSVDGMPGSGDVETLECAITASTTTCYDLVGPGGGGAGGALRVVTPTLTGSALRMTVMGGSGGNGSSYTDRAGDGGPGSAGFFHVDGHTWSTSCNALHTASPTLGDGTYLLAEDTIGTSPFYAYCDMTYDGGGWTLILDTVNKLGPLNLVQALPVLPSTGRAMPLGDMQRLANGATRVHIRTTGDTTQSVTSVAGAVGMTKLRSGVGMNYGVASWTAAEWTGPYNTATYMQYTCAAHAPYEWPTVYQSCGTNGMHLFGAHSRWNWNGNNPSLNVAMQVYVK